MVWCVKGVFKTSTECDSLQVCLAIPAILTRIDSYEACPVMSFHFCFRSSAGDYEYRLCGGTFTARCVVDVGSFLFHSLTLTHQLISRYRSASKFRQMRQLIPGSLALGDVDIWVVRD